MSRGTALCQLDVHMIAFVQKSQTLQKTQLNMQLFNVVLDNMLYSFDEGKKPKLLRIEI